MRAIATPTKAAKNGSAKMRCRGERSGARPVRTSVARSGGPAKAIRPQATSSGDGARRIATPQAASTRKTTNVQPLPPANPRRASVELVPRLVQVARRPCCSALSSKRSARRRSATANGIMARTATNDRQAGRRGRPRQRTSATAPRRRRRSRRTGARRAGARPQLRRRRPPRSSGARQRAHEEVDGERGDESEERVHAPEAPVDGEHPRSGCHDRRRDSRDVPVQAPAQVVADARPRPTAKTTEIQRSASAEESKRKARWTRTKWSGAPPRSHIVVTIISPNGRALIRARRRPRPRRAASSDVRDERDEEEGARADHRPATPRAAGTCSTKRPRARPGPAASRPRMPSSHSETPMSASRSTPVSIPSPWSR